LGGEVMRFLIVNEGSRGEVSSYIGGLKNIDELVNDWYEDRYELDIDFRDLKFGGISDLDCFLEIIFDEEDCYKIYVVNDNNEIDSEEYNIVDFVNDDEYRLEME
jgi:hypothetical protein